MDNQLSNIRIVLFICIPCLHSGTFRWDNQFVNQNNNINILKATIPTEIKWLYQQTTVERYYRNKTKYKENWENSLVFLVLIAASTCTCLQSNQ